MLKDAAVLSEDSILGFSITRQAAMNARIAACAVVGAGRAGLQGASWLAAKSGIASAVGSSAAKQVMRTGSKSAARLAVVFGAIEFGFDQASTLKKKHRGEITEKEFRRATGGNAGSAAGGVGGSIGGAALGTAILPGVGTMVGALIGGTAGGRSGRKLGRAVVELFE